MAYCLNNHQFGCRHQSKSSRAHEYLNLDTADSYYTHMQFTRAVSENVDRSRRSHDRHSSSHAQSSLPSGGYRSGHKQQPEVRRCDVHTYVIRSCRRLPNSSSHRASPCPKGRSDLLDPVVRGSSAHPTDASNDDKSSVRRNTGEAGPGERTGAGERSRSTLDQSRGTTYADP